jgi:hypothetical protein
MEKRGNLVDFEFIDNFDNGENITNDNGENIVNIGENQIVKL